MQVRFHGDAGKPGAKYYFVGATASSDVPAGYTALYPVSVDGQIGFIDRAGNIVIEPQFSSVGGCTEGLQRVAVSVDPAATGKPGDRPAARMGFIGEDGNYQIAPSLVVVEEFSEGLAVAGVDDSMGGHSYGFIDRHGTFAIPPIYGEAHSFSEGLAWVQDAKTSMWGCVDTKGGNAVPFSFDFDYQKYDWYFKEGRCFVSTGKQPELKVPNRAPECYIDRTGKSVLRMEGINGGTFFDKGVAFVHSRGEGGWVLVDQRGTRISRSCFDACYTYDRSMASGYGFEGGMRTGFGGEPSPENVYPGSTKEVETFSCGLALVRKGEKYGYIDRAGNDVIKPQYDEASFFVDGLARVKVGERFGFIDVKNRWVIKPRFDDAHDFQEGLAAVRNNGKCGYIDRQGRMIIAPQFDDAGKFRCGLAPVCEGGKWGYVDRAGKIVWKPTI